MLYIVVPTIQDLSHPTKRDIVSSTAFITFCAGSLPLLFRPRYSNRGSGRLEEAGIRRCLQTLPQAGESGLKIFLTYRRKAYTDHSSKQTKPCKAFNCMASLMPLVKHMEELGSV